MPRKKQQRASSSWIDAGSDIDTGSDVEVSEDSYEQAQMRDTAAKGPELVMPSMLQPTRRRTVPLRGSDKPLLQNPRWRVDAEDDNAAMSYIFSLGKELATFAVAVLALLWNIAKPLIKLLVVIFVLLAAGRYIFVRSIAPICSVPGVQYLGLSFCGGTSQPVPVEFDQLMNVQSAFEDVLQASSSGYRLPMSMKRSEATLRDVKHVIQWSSLPSRNELVFEFTGFIETAQQAAVDLTKFNSRIGRAVDHVIGANRWTLQILDGIEEKERSKTALAKFAGTLMLPFQGIHVTEHLLLEQYLRHTGAIEEQLLELIEEAEALMGILRNLDDRLDVIQSISTRDGVVLKGSRDDLLAQLWTKLGGNRSSKQKYSTQLHLLNQVGSYRKAAWEHITGTLLKLQQIAVGLEDLRERVGGPDVLSLADIPIRLHIDHIQMAVDRLDEQRTETRRLESEHHRRVLDHDKNEQQLLLLP